MYEYIFVISYYFTISKEKMKPKILLKYNKYSETERILDNNIEKKSYLQKVCINYFIHLIFLLCNINS